MSVAGKKKKKKEHTNLPVKHDVTYLPDNQEQEHTHKQTNKKKKKKPKVFCVSACWCVCVCVCLFACVRQMQSAWFANLNGYTSAA